MKSHGFLKEIAEDAHTGFELAIPTHRYRKLVVESRNAMNYTEAAFWCSSEYFYIISVHRINHYCEKSQNCGSESKTLRWFLRS